MGNKASEQQGKDIEAMGYTFRTKPVKRMIHSIDASSITNDSTALLRQFIRKALLRKYDLETIEYLNGKFHEMNTRGVYSIEDMKCNFDVEIGTDMLIAAERKSIDTFCLWSGDSDFADVIDQLLALNKRVVLFATARKVSKELNALQSKGLFIFDIAKLRNYICWKKEIRPKIS